jgi:hypothetical protein
VTEKERALLRDLIARERLRRQNGIGTDGRLKGGSRPRTEPIESVESAPCECGCGELANPGRRFRIGHHTRLRRKVDQAAHGNA